VVRQSLLFLFIKDSLMKFNVHVALSLVVLLSAVVLGTQLSLSSAEEKKDSKPLMYELRTYTTADGRLPALHKRFSEHTMQIFEKHGMQNVIYWVPADQENTLVYVIAHKSQEAADASWAAFRKDPEWQKAYKASTADGKIVTKVVNQFLTATEYSPMK